MSLVDRVDLSAIESMVPAESGAIDVVASWDVYGTVRHWGHVHYRCNTYRARVTLVPSEDYWKLTDLELLDQARVI